MVPPDDDERVRASAADERVGARAEPVSGTEARQRSGRSPVPLSTARAAIDGARAVTRAACIGGAMILIGMVVLDIAVAETSGSEQVALLARGSIASLAVVAPIAAIGEPLRIGAARAMLMRDLERDAEDSVLATTERRALEAGPRVPLLVAGAIALGSGVLLAPVGALFALDAEAPPLARVLGPMAGGLLLLVGIALVVGNRRRGPAHRRWQERLRALGVRERAGSRASALPGAPARSERRSLAIAGAIAGFGAVVFFVAVLLRQPGRGADPITWDEPGERLIDVLVIAGGTMLAAGCLGALVVQAVAMLRASLRDERTVRALERGEHVPQERRVAVLHGRGALERLAMALGVLGWLLATLGSAPGAITGIDGAEAAAAIAPLGVVTAPGLALVGASWILGSLGVARVRSRRARVLAAAASS